MTTHAILMVKHPREQLRKALVERTWELAPLLNEIAAVELAGEDAADTGERSATHVWRAKANVPPLLTPHIDADYFSWTAVVEWRENDFASCWRIEPHALRESLSCVAQVTLGEALGGHGTRVGIDLDIDGLDGRAGIATIANRIVMVNWQKLVDAARRKLEA